MDPREKIFLASESPDLAVEVSGLIKRYKIRETKLSLGKRQKFARLLLGESFQGTVEVVQRNVLDCVELQVNRGECVGILGPNGASKSTLLEVLAGGILPDGGRVKIMGHDMTEGRGVTAHFITPIFPMLGPEDTWTARQNLEYLALLHNIPKRTMVERMDSVLGRVGLKDRADETVMKYSSGMRVRLVLAMGLLIDNPIYLMDEPFVGLDPLTVRGIRRFVKGELVGKRTILLATHILADVEELCDRVILMDEGKVVAVGTISDLKRSIRGIEVIDSEIQVDDVDALVEAISPLNGVLGCTCSSPSTDDAITSAKIHTRDSRNLLPLLIEAIYKAGGKIRHIEISEPTLEDVFIHYTGRGLH